MDLEFVIARLKAKTQGLRAVGGAADLDAALASVLALPAAYAIPLGDDTHELPQTGHHEEAEQINFGVVIAVANLRDPRGEAAQAALAPVRRMIRHALSGWVPYEETGEPVSKTSGRLLRMDGDGRLWWIDNYRLTTFFRSEE